MLTVRALTAELGLNVVAGSERVEEPIRWVHISELDDPTPWLTGGELLLTTGIQLDTAASQRSFVRLLARHGLAGLGLGTGFAHKRIPNALADEAVSRALPLFEVPYEMPFIAITERMRDQVVRETERRLAGDVLAEALRGRLEPDEVQGRLRPFGINAEAAVLVFEVADPALAVPRLEAALERAGAAALVATTSVARRELLCAVVDAEAGDPVELARQARVALAEEGSAVRAAASRPGSVSGLSRSFHEARCALEATSLANGKTPEVASHEDLGAFTLLLALQDDEALRLYSDSLLTPIEATEGEYGGELLRSLEAYIEQNGQWERAARELYCHRHTLRYRIRRIEELTGRDLSRAHDRIELWLALRAREIASHGA